MSGLFRLTMTEEQKAKEEEIELMIDDAVEAQYHHHGDWL
jgi:hypothetical protein